MKRFLSLLLAIAMLTAMLPQISISAFATEQTPVTEVTQNATVSTEPTLVPTEPVLVPTEPVQAITDSNILTLDTPLEVTIAESYERKTLEFTPAQSGLYLFTSTSDLDTCAELYDGAQTQLATDDDGGYNSNFLIGYSLEAGHTYSLITRCFSDATGSFTVTVTLSPVERVEVQPLSLILNTRGYLTNGWSSNAQSYQYYYHYYWWDHVAYTVYFTDGTSAEVTGRFFEHNGVAYESDPIDLQYVDTAWTAGNTYDVSFTLIGHTVQTTVSIMESPVVSLDVAPITLFEGFGGLYQSDYIEAENGYSETYFSFVWNKYLSYTATLADGTTVTGNGSSYTYDENCYVPILSAPEQNYQNVWTAGNTYMASISVLGYEAEVPVTITKSPVVGVSFDPIRILADDYTIMSKYDKETDQWIEFRAYDWYNRTSYTVTFENGETTTGNSTSIPYLDDELLFNYSDDQGPGNEWTVGNTYEGTFRVTDISYTVPVTIIDTPIQSISFDPISIQEQTNGSFYTENEIEYFRYYWWNQMNYTVTFVDGTTQTGSGDWINYNGQRYGFTLNDTQSSESPWTAGNTYDITVSVLGYDTQVSVTITEGPIRDIQIHPLSLMENSCGYWQQYTTDGGTEASYYHYQWWPQLSYTVTFSDGYVMDVTGNYFTYNDQSYYLSWDDPQHAFAPWTAGNSYTIDISVASCRSEATVTIVQNPIQSIVFNPVTMPAGTGGYLQDNGDRSYYHYEWWNNLSYTVTFSDGTSQTLTGTSFTYNGQEYNVSYIDNQNYDNTIGTGFHTMTAIVANVEYPVPVTIVEPTVEQLGMPMLIPGMPQTAEISQPGQRVYLAFTCNVSGFYTFTTDVQADTYGYLYDSSYRELQCNDDGGVENNFLISQSLEAGRTYILAVRFWDAQYTGSFPVSVTKSLGITSITVDPVSIPEKTGGCFEQSPAGSWYYYRWWEKLSYTVTFDDGSTAQGNGMSFMHNGAMYSISSSWDNQWEDPHWQLGNTYTGTFRILNCEASTSVTITESPVASIVPNPSSIPMGTNGYLSSYWNEETQSYVDMFYYRWWETLSYTVTFRNGETLSFTGQNFSYDGASYELSCSDTQYVSPWTEGNTYYPTISLGSVSAQVPVTITESPIESIVLQPVQILKESNGSWVNEGGQPYFQYYWWNNLPFTVFFKNGDTVSGTGGGFWYNGQSYNFQWRDSQHAGNPWTPGNSYSVNVSLGGITIPTSVTIVDVLQGRLNENVTWSLSGDGVLTISGEGEIQDFNGSHEQPWDPYRSSIRQVVVEPGITYIGRWTFYSHPCLTSVTLPDTLVTIGDSAFAHCGMLSDVTFSDSIAHISDGAFRSCTALSSVTLGSNVVSIGYEAFAFCTEMTQLTLPATLQNISYRAFASCTDLTDVYFTGTQNRWNMLSIDAENSALYNATLHCTGVATEIASGDCGEAATWLLDSDGVLTISGTGAMADYASAEELPWYDYTYEIRTVIIESGITTVGNYSFYSCGNLQAVTFPETLTSIGSYSFYGCELITYIMLPDTFAQIGEYAFYGCTELSELYVGPGLVSIGTSAFEACDYLDEVYYTASGIQWGQVQIQGGNSVLYDAYLYTIEAEGILKSGVCGDELTWILDDSYTLTISGSGAMADYYYTRAPWGFWANDIRTLVIEDGMTYIGMNAFRDCANLNDVTIPGTVTQIGIGAFSGCTGLTSIVIPEGVEDICDEAFLGCSALYDITLPESLLTIGFDVFNSCYGLTEVFIPAGVQGIGHSAFSGCNSLTRIVVDEANEWYCTDENGVLFNKEMTQLIRVPCALAGAYTVPDGIEDIYVDAFSGCWAITSVSIPDSVTNISPMAFSNCTSLTEVSLGSGITSLESGVFSNTGLTSIVIPEGITSIGEGAFRDCGRLTQVVIPESVTYISDNAFAWCTGLTAVDIPESVTYIGQSAFEGCESLESIAIPDAVTELGSYAFSECLSLSSVTMGNNVSFIGDYAFFGCDNLTAISVSEGVEHIGEGAFEACANLTDVTIPEGVTSFVYRMFAGCASLQTIQIPTSVQSIDNQTFAQCSGLTEITVPDSVLSIGDLAFNECHNLTSVTLGSGVEFIGSNLFADCMSLTGIWVNDNNRFYSSDEHGIFFDKEKTTLYRCPTGFTGAYVMPETVENITYGAFTGCEGLTAITIPGNVVAVGMDRFSGCSGLESVTLGEGITAIGDFAFADCYALSSLSLPESLTYIGNEAFTHCYSLTSVTLPANTDYIASYAFSWCENLETITIPVAMTTIEPWAFVGCNNLQDVYYTGLTAQWNEINIAYGNESLIYADIHCTDTVEVTGITISTLPDTTVYTVGQSLDLTGLVVSVTYSDGSALQLWDGYTISGFDSETTGTKTVTITYEDYTAEFTVTVTEAPVVILSQPADQQGEAGSTVSFTVEATGVAAYRWQYSRNSGSSWSNTTMTGYTTPTLQVGVTEARNGYQYRCKLTGNDGSTVYTDAATLTLYVPAPELVRIEIAQLPEKLVYITGENLDTTGLVLNAIYSDGTSVEVTDGYTVEADLSVLGSQLVTVTYETCTTCYSVLVQNPVVLERIEITRLPEKLVYITGEDPDTTGLVLNAIYSDGRTVAMTDGYTVEADLSVPGTQYITVTYETCTASYSVEVQDPVVLEYIEIATLPEKLAYITGEDPDTTGLVLNAIYSDGSSIEITDGYTVEADLSVSGTAYITIMYEGCSASYSVEVRDPVVLERIEIAQLPEKLVYITGEDPDTTGLMLNAIYSDGSSIEITDGYTVEADLSVPGTTYITVMYEGCSASFSVTVMDPQHYGYCEHCAEEVVWEDWTAEDGAIIESGHYRLSNDVSTKKLYRIGTTTNTGKDVVLDLNGHTLSSSQRAFTVYTGSTLSVVDSDGSGMITGGAAASTGGAIMVSSNGKLNLYGGTITSSSSGNGGCIYVNKGTFNMYGGKLVGATLASGKLGGAVYLLTGNFYMYDGIIVDGTAGSGNSIYVGNGSTVLLGGGTVGEVMVVASAKVTLSGAPMIGNLDLSGGALIELGELSDRAAITVTANGVFTQPCDNAQMYVSCFKTMDADAYITVVENALSVTYPEEAPELIDIAITSLPDKTEYKCGDTLDTTGLVLTGYYSDGTEAEITEGYTIDGFDPDTVGPLTLTVWYGDFGVSFDIVFLEPQIVGIQIAQLPQKLVYTVNEALDTTGLILTATYDDGSTEEITEGFTVVGYDPSVVGDQTLTVDYEGFLAEFTVTVSCLPVEIISQPEDQTAAVGETAVFTFAAENAKAFRWQYRKGVSGSWFSTTMTGYNTNTLSVPMTAARDGYQYRCQITGLDGSIVYTDVVTLHLPAPQLVNIEIISLPEKLVYNMHDSLDTTGLALQGNYDNGSSVEITEGFAADADLSVPGRQDVTVTYEGLTTTYRIEVLVDSGTCGRNLTWTLDGDGLLTISGTGPMYTYGIDTAPWYSANKYYCKVTSVVIGDEVTSIGQYAFWRLYSLKSVTIGQNVTTITPYAFYDCVSVEELVIPDSVTTLERYSFCGMDSLRTVHFGAGLTTIGEWAFQDCAGLQEVFIPAGVTTIGSRAFTACPALTGIYVSQDNTVYSNDDRGILFNKDQTRLIQAPGGISGSYAIADTVTDIDDWAFYECGELTHITIPGSVETVGPVFSGCTKLQAAVLNEGVDMITGVYAFTGCTSLTEITLPLSLRYIGDSAFSACKNLSIVRYNGTAAQWARISIGNYNDYLLNATLYAAEPVLTGISISQLPDKLEYAAGESLDTTGLALTATYHDDTTAQITEGFTVEGFDTNAGGEQTLTVTYEGFTAEFTVTVLAKQQVEITVQPADQVGAFGSTVQFTVAAINTVSYQWQYRRNAESSWQTTKLTGYNTATLSVVMTSGRNGYQYRCVLTGEDGTVIYSDPATLTMDAKLEITSQPADATALESSTAPFTVVATDVLSYRWQYRRNEDDSWHATAMKGYVTDTLQVQATTGRDSYQYRCKITGIDGSVVYSDPATLTVVPCILTQPTSNAAQVGETAIFQVETQNVTAYQWLYRRTSDAGWSNTGMDGNKTATLRVPMTAGRAGYQYMCKLTNSDGVTLYTDVVTLYMAPQIVQQPVDVTVSIGSKAVFSVVATDVVSYQWQYSRNGGASWSNTSKTGNKTDTLTIDATAGNNGYTYRCKITGVEGYVLYTDAVTLTTQ